MPKSAPYQRWIPRGEPFHPGGTGGNGAFPAILEHMIRQRGLPPDTLLADYLNPRLKSLKDPFLIPEMDRAVDRILLAVDRGERVCVFGDYDVDGITAITLLHGLLRSYGLEPRAFIPRRSAEGYGLSQAAIARCMAEGPKPDLLITVDCGTVSVAEVAELRAAGIDVIIVDHHEPLPDRRPACHALVNPKCGPDSGYLCAAGVVFKLGHALLKRRRTDFDLKEALDLVAVATISDIVPMIGENRLLVRHGLKALPLTRNPGLRALQETSGMSEAATSMDIGFRLGPRLNAAGRMDEPEKALKLLTTADPDEAARLAQELEQFNRQRQKYEMDIRSQALASLNGFDPARDPVIVLGSREWHPGVVGIVASRLMRQFYKPTFIVAIDANGIGKGSGRSIEGVSLVDAIRACETELLAGGGHAMAAGLTIDEGKIDSFRARFGDYVLATTTEEQRQPRVFYDAEIAFGDLSLEFLSDYELLQPFGAANPQPVFVSRGVELCRPPLHMKNQHLRFTLRQTDCYTELDAVYFGGGEVALPDPPWDVAFHLDRNTFRGRTSLQLVIQDLKPAGGPD
jgi:single-stranded-DNA-specific exonuclease